MTNEETQGRRIILYADDDFFMREMFKSLANVFLKEYELEIFENGGYLAERIERDQSDLALIITDNEMPVLKGSEVIEGYASRVDVPFVLWYGGDENIGRKAVEDGAKRYFIKCSSERSLSEIMEELKELAD